MGTFTIRPAEQQDVIDALNDTNIKNTINALAPYSGYTQVSKKLDNFVFQTSSSFLNKVADKNRFVKFGDKVVDTYGNLSEYIASAGTTGTYVTMTNTSGVSIGDYIYVYNINGAIVGGGVIISISTNSFIEIVGQAYTRVIGQLYAIRKIQTADFTNTVPDVAEIITNGSNTTSAAVSAGDYVLDGSELVTNGTFDSDTSGWNITQGTASVSDGKITITSNGTAYAIASQQINLKANIKYVFFASQLGGTDGVAFFRLRSTERGSVIAGTSGWNSRLSFSYTPTTDVSYFIDIECDGSLITDTVIFDNISVKRVSDTFRAKQDAPIGTALTNTTYFEDRTQIGVTNQALMAHKYNTTTNSYEGLHTEILFNDVSKEQLLDNSIWMSNNGFSKVSQFLYSKSDSLYLPVGIVQC